MIGHLVAFKEFMEKKVQLSFAMFHEVSVTNWTAQNIVTVGMPIFLCRESTPSSRDRPSPTANPKKHRNGLRFLPARLFLPPRGFCSGFHAGLVSTNVSQMMGGREDEKSEMFHCGR